MAVSLCRCPSLSVILWGHVRRLACPDVFSYLSAFQQVPSSFPTTFTLFSLLPSPSISPLWGIDQCFQVINMHLCHSIFSLICPQCQQRDARREERKRNVQMKEWRMRRDNVRTQKRTVSLIGKRYKEWVINNIHRSRHGCVFFFIPRHRVVYICVWNEMKHSCGGNL